MTPRGRAYTAQRAAVEHILQVLYAGDWPARLWAQVPGATTVQVRRAQLPLLPPGTPPLRLGFASDLHLGPTTPPALLRAAAEALAEARLERRRCVVAERAQEKGQGQWGGHRLRAQRLSSKLPSHWRK
jgi:hypothetical protein